MEDSMQTQLWIERVPSQCNPADYFSREEIEEFSGLQRMRCDAVGPLQGCQRDQWVMTVSITSMDKKKMNSAAQLLPLFIVSEGCRRVTHILEVESTLDICIRVQDK